MKNKFRLLLPGILSLLLSYFSASPAYSQTPRWVSDRGYWVVESNLHRPKENIVYFYSNQGICVYHESLNGIYLNLNRRKVKMRLRKVLDLAVAAWERQQPISGSQRLLANSFRK